jgi:large subunit ribosomal protein L18
MKNVQQEKVRRRTRAHQRLRQRVAGTQERPRLAVFKSLRFVYAQVIDDRKGTTLVQANSQEAGVREAVKGGASSKAAARWVGETIAARAKEAGIDKVVFDRGGFIYHGKIKEVADGARAKGLEF